MLQLRKFTAGEALFLEGDPSDLAYIIRSGRVEILKETPTAPIRLAVLGHGDVFGEMGLIDERPRSATARACEPVIVAAIDRTEFMRLILHQPREVLGLIRALFERLRSMNRMLEGYNEPTRQAPRIPRVRLLPLTPRTKEDVPADGFEVTRFPFRIGRKPSSEESEALAFNEVELSDTMPYTVSLNHFSLDLDQEGVVVRDRGSRRGTIVNNQIIGLDTMKESAPLRVGDNEVVLGGPDSSYRLRFIVESA
jgi:CRP-like cAMP-binding protein